MLLVDANVLLYAINSDAKQHDDARDWLDDALRGPETVGFAWIVLLAFLRLTTRPGALRPITFQESRDQVADWLDAPAATTVAPRDGRHLERLDELLSDTGSAGNLVNDAHLAAIALEHSASIVTYDTDFARFASVRWSRPGPPPTG